MTRDLPPRSGTYRVGILGGMFDPPHRGHVAMVDAARRACELDRVLVVPAGIPPHRPAPPTPARARLALCVKAFADLEHAAVLDTEVVRGEAGDVGYMVDTVEEVLELPSDLGYDKLTVAVTLVLGADQAVALPGWHRARELLGMVALGVVERPALVDRIALDAALRTAADPGAVITRVTMPAIDVSSTLVRAAAAAGDTRRVGLLVPPAIVGDVLHWYGTHR